LEISFYSKVGAGDGFYDPEGKRRSGDFSLLEWEEYLRLRIPLSRVFLVGVELGGIYRKLDTTELGKTDSENWGIRDNRLEAFLRSHFPSFSGGIWFYWIPPVGDPHGSLDFLFPRSVPLSTGSHRLGGGILLSFPFSTGELFGGFGYEHPLISRVVLENTPFLLLRGDPLRRVWYQIFCSLFHDQPLSLLFGISGFHEAKKNSVNLHTFHLGVKIPSSRSEGELELSLPLYGKEYPPPSVFAFLEPEPVVGIGWLFGWKFYLP